MQLKILLTSRQATQFFYVIHVFWISLSEVSLFARSLNCHNAKQHMLNKDIN